MRSLYEYHQDEVVKLHSLGPMHGDAEYLAIIKGKSIDHGPGRASTSYIVHMLTPVDPAYPFTHATFPAACIKPCSSRSYWNLIRIDWLPGDRWSARVSGNRVFGDSPERVLDQIQVRIDALLLAGKQIKIEGAADRTSVPSSTPRP